MDYYPETGDTVWVPWGKSGWAQGLVVQSLEESYLLVAHYRYGKPSSLRRVYLRLRIRPRNPDRLGFDKPSPRK